MNDGKKMIKQIIPKNNMWSIQLVDKTELMLTNKEYNDLTDPFKPTVSTFDLEGRGFKAVLSDRVYTDDSLYLIGFELAD